ncbi:hypothetical protein [Mesorhizobium sp. M0491]|uniref:hypothetical protein n=1 Tax=Mesorhizobium sp. M0491 TaxID=2956950 RepID=UPI00333636A4
MAFEQGLQDQLDEIWYRLPAGTPGGQREERQRMLVREFQIAARGQYGAQDSQAGGAIDANRLRQVQIRQISAAAGLPATIYPSGDADAVTRAAILAWRQNQLRAPVIFQAISPSDPADPWKTIVSQGFIFHDELTDKKPRVFAVDFTDRQDLNDKGKPWKVPVGTAVSRVVKHKKKAPATFIWGSQSTVAQSLTPFDADHVVGQAWSALTPEKQSTFRVIKALAQVEAAVFDGINAWDTSVLSAGPYHYTAFPAGDVGPSELGAFLAYFATRSAAEFRDLFLGFGLGPREAWSPKLFNKSDRTYRAEIGFVDAAGSLATPSLDGRNWLRTWHSFYRVQYALRSSPGLQGSVWPFARQRIRDVLATPFGAGAPPGAKTLKDVFKSERTVAMLMRWHVFRPAHITTGGHAGAAPARLVDAAGLAGKDVSTWTRKEEEKLASAFLNGRTTSLAGKYAEVLSKSLGVVNALRDPTAPKASKLPLLRLDRTFALHTDGIPFPDPGPVSLARSRATSPPRARAGRRQEARS